jgi:hypothetical protein
MGVRVAAVALLVLVLAACGGRGSGTSQGTTTHAAAVAARWSSGLHAWGTRMNRAIDGLSVLFSQPADVRGIQAGNARVGAILTRYEQTLDACSIYVARLGTPPAALVLARREALHACSSLQHAADLIRSGVRQFQQGLGPDVLNDTSAPLSAGEDGVRRALLDTTPA